jgi:hypothetical protein
MDNMPILAIGAGAGANSGIRNPYAVMQLIPGTDWRPDASVRVNGTPGNTQAMRVEGMDTTNNMWANMSQYVQQGVDAIQEFAIATSNYAAEFGQAGAGVFNLTMKSGTNQLHGSAYLYEVNEALNAATPYSNDGSGNKIKPRARRHDFGFTAGGPIYIPKVVDGRDIFFFSRSNNGNPVPQSRHNGFYCCDAERGFSAIVSPVVRAWASRISCARRPRENTICYRSGS